MPRFRPTPSRPAVLVASIVALSEQTNRLALDSAMEATRAGTEVSAVIEHVSRLAVGAGVSAGEMTWLVSELEAARPSDAQIAEAAVAVSGMQSCMSAIAHAIAEIGGRVTEVDAAAEALRRVVAQLESLLARLQPCV